jgi:hypothetical protein
MSRQVEENDIDAGIVQRTCKRHQMLPSASSSHAPEALSEPAESDGSDHVATGLHRSAVCSMIGACAFRHAVVRFRMSRPRECA